MVHTPSHQLTISWTRRALGWKGFTRLHNLKSQHIKRRRQWRRERNPGWNSNHPSPQLQQWDPPLSLLLSVHVTVSTVYNLIHNPHPQNSKKNTNYPKVSSTETRTRPSESPCFIKSNATIPISQALFHCILNIPSFLFFPCTRIWGEVDSMCHVHIYVAVCEDSASSIG